LLRSFFVWMRDDTTPLTRRDRRVSNHPDLALLPFPDNRVAHGFAFRILSSRRGGSSFSVL